MLVGGRREQKSFTLKKLKDVLCQVNLIMLITGKGYLQPKVICLLLLPFLFS